MVYFYDPDARLLINPTNVIPALTAAKYVLDVTLRNFHVTKRDDEEFWDHLKDDLQLQLLATGTEQH